MGLQCSGLFSRNPRTFVFAATLGLTLVPLPAEALRKTYAGNCSFALVNKDKPSEYVRAHCVGVANKNDWVKISFRRQTATNYPNVHSKVGKTLRCTVVIEQIGNTPARFGVTGC